MALQAKTTGVLGRNFSISTYLNKSCARGMLTIALFLVVTQLHAVTIPAPHTSASYPDHLIIGPVGIYNQSNDPSQYIFHSETWTFTPPGGGHWDFAEIDFHCDNEIEWSIFNYWSTGGISDETENRNHNATHYFAAGTTGNVLFSHENSIEEEPIQVDDPESDEEEEIEVGCFQYDFDVTLYYKIEAPGIPASISTNSPNSDGSITVSWGVASGNVYNYQLEESKNGGAYTNVYAGTLRTKTLSNRTQGSTYTYRVRASAGSNGLYKYSGWRTSAAVSVPIPPSVESSVIYIHTDLLGSPVAESNEAGEIEQ